MARRRRPADATRRCLLGSSTRQRRRIAALHGCTRAGPRCHIGTVRVGDPGRHSRTRLKHSFHNVYTPSKSIHLSNLWSIRGITMATVGTKHPMPRPGTRTRRVWDISDAITRETGRRAQRREVIERYVAEGGNPNTGNTQYQYWKTDYDGRHLEYDPVDIFADVGAQPLRIAPRRPGGYPLTDANRHGAWRRRPRYRTGRERRASARFALHGHQTSPQGDAGPQ